VGEKTNTSALTAQPCESRASREAGSFRCSDMQQQQHGGIEGPFGGAAIGGIKKGRAQALDPSCSLMECTRWNLSRYMSSVAIRVCFSLMKSLHLPRVDHTHDPASSSFSIAVCFLQLGPSSNLKSLFNNHHQYLNVKALKTDELNEYLHKHPPMPPPPNLPSSIEQTSSPHHHLHSYSILSLLPRTNPTLLIQARYYYSPAKLASSSIAGLFPTPNLPPSSDLKAHHVLVGVGVQSAEPQQLESHLFGGFPSEMVSSSTSGGYKRLFFLALPKHKTEYY
ncbi:uncharacterized protein TRIREDRAFT_106274, partial [Trichoderma reesei QM6a]